YEGPVGGGRGRVRRWDRGTFAWRTRDEGRLVAEVCGGRLQGALELRRLTEQEWQGGVVPRGAGGRGGRALPPPPGRWGPAPGPSGPGCASCPATAGRPAAAAWPGGPPGSAAPPSGGR